MCGPIFSMRKGKKFVEGGVLPGQGQKYDLRFRCIAQTNQGAKPYHFNRGCSNPQTLDLAGLADVEELLAPATDGRSTSVGAQANGVGFAPRRPGPFHNWVQQLNWKDGSVHASTACVARTNWNDWNFSRIHSYSKENTAKAGLFVQEHCYCEPREVPTL